MNVKPVKVAVVGCGIISQVYLRNMTRLFSILDVSLRYIQLVLHLVIHHTRTLPNQFHLRLQF